MNVLKEYHNQFTHGEWSEGNKMGGSQSNKENEDEGLNQCSGAREDSED